MSRRAALIALLLLLAALAPRLIAHERFLTVDETAHWVGRTERFLEGVRALRPAATNQAPHPGVTTMWAASAGLAAHEALVEAGLRADAREPRLRAMRLPIAFLCAASVAGAFLLLRRIVDERIAVVAALLWAGEPFLVGHARIVHVDALVTSFFTLSLLAGLVGVREGSRWWALSGALGSLALLSKLPAVLALPLLLLPLLVAHRGRPPARPIVAWGVAAAATFLVVWPAVPFAFESVVASFRTGAGWATSEHERGNFFLGEPVGDPGALFYPVVLALRLAPWTALGLVAAAILWRRVPAPARWFAVWAVIFVVFVGLQAKKFDRYALPVFPWLDIVGAAGLVALFDAAADRVVALRRAALPAVAALTATIATNLALAHPYELLWYDPLLGGVGKAEELVLVGWGEGMDRAGEWIAERADGCHQQVAVSHAIRVTLEPFVCQDVVTLDHVGQAEFAALYVNQIQRRRDARLTASLREIGPAHVVYQGGVALVEVYDLRPLQRLSAADRRARLGFPRRR